MELGFTFKIDFWMAYFDEKNQCLATKQAGNGKKPPPRLVLSVVRYQMGNKWSKILIIAELDMTILTFI